MVSVKERTKWAITYVVKTRNLSNKKVARLLKINENTIGSYRNMVADPKVDFIVKFCDTFDFNILWFIKGTGEPFYGASVLYPEICKPECLQKTTEDLKIQEAEVVCETCETDDMKKVCNAVLRTSEELVTDISANIASFFSSVYDLCRQQANREKNGLLRISKIQSRLDDIELRLNRMEKKKR